MDVSRFIQFLSITNHQCRNLRFRPEAVYRIFPVNDCFSTIAVVLPTGNINSCTFSKDPWLVRYSAQIIARKIKT